MKLAAESSRGVRVGDEHGLAAVGDELRMGLRVAHRTATISGCESGERPDFARTGPSGFGAVRIITGVDKGELYTATYCCR